MLEQTRLCCRLVHPQPRRRLARPDKRRPAVLQNPLQLPILVTIVVTVATIMATGFVVGRWVNLYPIEAAVVTLGPTAVTG